MGASVHKIHLDGLGERRRYVRFDYNAFTELEEILGKPIAEIIEDMGDGKTGLKEIRALLFCGLKWSEKNLTLEKVGDYLGAYLKSRDAESAITDLGGKLGKAIQASGILGNAEDIDETEEPDDDDDEEGGEDDPPAGEPEDESESP